MDGNRRWARAAGHLDPSIGHKYGAEHLADFLRWSDDWGIEHLMVYVLSADNIRKRPRDQVSYLFDLLATTVPDLLSRPDLGWRLHVSGDESLLPDAPRHALERARAATAGRRSHLTLAIGYDGRQDIVDGIRRSLVSSGEPPSERDISSALAGGPVKDVDLVIGTSESTGCRLLPVAVRRRRDLHQPQDVAGFHRKRTSPGHSPSTPPRERCRPVPVP